MKMAIYIQLYLSIFICFLQLFWPKKKKFRWYKINAIIKLDKLAVINFNIIT